MSNKSNLHPRFSFAEAWGKYATCEHSDLSASARLVAFAMMTHAAFYRDRRDWPNALNNANDTAPAHRATRSLTKLDSKRFREGLRELERKGWCTFYLRRPDYSSADEYIEEDVKLDDLEGTDGTLHAKLVIKEEYFGVNYPTP